MAKRGRPRKEKPEAVVPEEFKNTTEATEDKPTEIPTEIEDTLSEEKVETATLPQGYVLCKVEFQGDFHPDVYSVRRGGETYHFTAPEYTCPLPEELAKIYDSDKFHVIKIA